MSMGIQSTQDSKWICATCGQPEDECWCRADSFPQVINNPLSEDNEA